MHCDAWTRGCEAPAHRRQSDFRKPLIQRVREGHQGIEIVLATHMQGQGKPVILTLLLVEAAQADERADSGQAWRSIAVAGARILLPGITFKENCPDLRNTRVIDLAREFGDYGSRVDIYDP